MCVPRFVTLFSLLALLAALPAKADEPTTAPASGPAAFAVGSAREAIRLYSDALPAGGMKAALAAYHCTKDKEQALAKALARVDLAAAQLEAWAKAKFGDKTAPELDHAMRQASDDDLAASTERVDADRATVTFPNGYGPLEMIKADGKWKVDVAALIGADDDAAAMAETENAVAEALEHILGKAKSGDYANAYLLNRAVKQQLYRVLGDEEEQE